MIWNTLGEVAPGDLVDARLQLHHAAQVVAAAGLNFLEPQPDDSHPNLVWVDEFGALMSRPVANGKLQVGLRVADCALISAGDDGSVRTSLALPGRSLDEAHSWLADEAKRVGLDVPAAGLARTDYEIPAHAVGSGSRFAPIPEAAFAELALWFGNGQRVLDDWSARSEGASDVRCWPHHFDLGSLIVVGTNDDGSLAKSIGLGLSPGDESYPEPYFYVSPWPYPAADALPALESGGHWHSEGYTSAILKGSDLLAGSPDAQLERLNSFVGSAIDTSRRVLAG